MMNRSRNLLLLLLCAQLAQAQGGSLQQAERYRASGDLYNAAVQYEQYLGIRKGHNSGYAPYSALRTGSLGAKTATGGKEAVYAKLATCYYELRDYAKAVEYYAKAGKLGADDGLRYAKSLRATGRAADAKALLESLAQGGAPRSEVLLELAALNFSAVPDPLVTVAKEGGDANTGHGNYAAVKAGSVLFFTSSRSDSSANAKGPKRNHLYRIVGTEALLADPIMGQDIDQGLCSFTPDGRRVYFTAWKKDGARQLAQIYTCTREDGGWTAPVALGADINVPGSNNAQPCFVEENGKRYLYFSSDRAGGLGGYDLYVANVDAAGMADGVMSLGIGVNTAGDEAAPFYHAPSRQLVFASNGRPGMGGFDLYATKQGASGFSDAPQHLGTPVNSVKDDSYFYSGSKDSNIFRNAYLSSDRASDCCLEIYTVSRQDPPPAPQPPADTVVVVTPPPPAPWAPPVLLFDFDKAELTAEAKAQLDTVFLQMERHPEWRLRIGGYTDGKGGESYNNRLSDRRARAVREYLGAKGIVPGRLWIKGFGECCPVAPEQVDGRDDPGARSRNRRVELRVEQ